MDDLLTSYISQMLTTMSKQRNSRGHSKWTFDWREAAELVRLLRPIGRPCSWGRAFAASQLWRMSRTPSASSQGSVYPDEDSSSASSEDDYLWAKLLPLRMWRTRFLCLYWMIFSGKCIICLNAQLRYQFFESNMNWNSFATHPEFLTITALNKQYLDYLYGKLEMHEFLKVLTDRF